MDEQAIPVNESFAFLSLTVNNYDQSEIVIQGDSEISLEKKCGVSFTQINSA
jgi:hypothetical protein